MKRISLILTLLLFCITISPLLSQTIYSKQIKGIRVEGVAEARFPITLLNSNPITISFDVDNPAVENFYVRILHCDRNWNVTQSSFINDPFSNYSRNQIPYKIAPTGVEKYKWTYSVKIPTTGENPNMISGMKDFEFIKHSGNYKFEIWNEKRTELLAEGKFFVAERYSDTNLTIYNRFLPSETAPKNRVNKAALSVSVSAFNNTNGNNIFQMFLKTVDIYRNRQIELPFRIDVDDNNPNTYIEGWETDRIKYIIDNLQPGNGYRRIDLRNADLYPPSSILSSRDGADISRWQNMISRDYNGTSVIVTDNRFADYVQYQFELIRPEENVNEKIYVVGDFNGWRIEDKWLLKYDSKIKRYTVTNWIRRGAYDYQYVLDGKDWITLEGNDWRNENVFTALLYYNDDRYGGFDRILLAAQKRSPGGTEPTSL